MQSRGQGGRAAPPVPPELASLCSTGGDLPRSSFMMRSKSGFGAPSTRSTPPDPASAAGATSAAASGSAAGSASAAASGSATGSGSAAGSGSDGEVTCAEERFQPGVQEGGKALTIVDVSLHEKGPHPWIIETNA
jgi:hypothetical protein